VNSLEYYQQLLKGGCTGDRLIRCPAIEPLPKQVEIVNACVDIARRLRIPLPKRIDVRWKYGSRAWEFTRGATSHNSATREISVFLDATLDPTELRRISFHELGHVSLYFSGAYRNMSLAAQEMSCDRFAIRALEAEAERRGYYHRRCAS